MLKTSDIIAVMGATGQQGGALAHELLAGGYQVRAITRKPDGEPAKALAKLGATVVRGDLDDAASIAAALKGAWGAYAVQNTWEAGVEGEERQGHSVAKVAAQAGIKHLVYSSVGSADRKTGIPHFENKFRVEQTVRTCGVPSWTIVRAVFFMENLLSPWFKPAIDNGQLALGIKPATVLQMIAVKDIGKYLKYCFEHHDRMKGKDIDIAGDQLTAPQAAQLISAAKGKPVTHFPVPLEEVRKSSEDYALMLDWFDKVGYDVDIAANAREFGIAPTKFADWAKGVTW